MTYRFTSLPMMSLLISDMSVSNSFFEQCKTGLGHLLSVEQLTLEDVERILNLASHIKKTLEKGTILSAARGKILVNLFYEPSTRTSCSFQAAMLRLGGQTIVIDDVSSSSVSKGETIEDTSRCLGCYGDVLAMRHPQKGAVAAAAAVSPIPVLNAGDGVGEHPSQALLDLFTLYSELGSFSNTSRSIVVTMVGDLKHGRTVHSLLKLLSHFPQVSVSFVSPSSLSIPQDVLSYAEAKKISRAQEANVSPGVYSNMTLSQALPLTDALYVTRVQKERFASEAEYNEVKDEFIVTKDLLEQAGVKDHMRILHPLPRVNEISVDVDATPHAAYFRQMKNGLYVRMALLAIVLGVDQDVMKTCTSV